MLSRLAHKRAEPLWQWPGISGAAPCGEMSNFDASRLRGVQSI